MQNLVTLIGRLTRDPEFRLTPSGIPVVKFTVAIDNFKRDSENSADFIRVTAWRRLAEICNQFLKKGRLVAIEGRLQIDSYEKDGESREFAEVVADTMQMLEKSGTESSASIPSDPSMASSPF